MLTLAAVQLERRARSHEGTSITGSGLELAVACCVIGIPDRIYMLLGLIYGHWVMLPLYNKSQVTEMSADHALAF